MRYAYALLIKVPVVQHYQKNKHPVAWQSGLFVSMRKSLYKFIYKLCFNLYLKCQFSMSF